MSTPAPVTPAPAPTPAPKPDEADVLLSELAKDVAKFGLPAVGVVEVLAHTAGGLPVSWQAGLAGLLGVVTALQSVVSQLKVAAATK